MRVPFLSRAYLKIGNKKHSVKGKNKKYKINNINRLLANKDKSFADGSHDRRGNNGF
jgi:hypothetical protein